MEAGDALAVRFTRIAIAILASVFIVRPAAAEVQPAAEIVSVFPLGGQPGTTIDVVIRGERLQSTHAVWTDCDAISAQVTRVEWIYLDEEAVGQYGKKGQSTRPGQRVHARLTIAADAATGAHAIRVVSSRGVTGPYPFLVHSEPTLREKSGVKNSPENAQSVRYPIVVNGRLDRPGETDFYELSIDPDSELQFEVLTGSGVLHTKPVINKQPDFVLFSHTGSFFNPKRTRRIETTNRSLYYRFAPQTFLPRHARRFSEAGRYFAVVSTLQGDGGPDHCYQLRIRRRPNDSDAPLGWSPTRRAHSASITVRDEHSFERRLDRAWLDSTVARAPQKIRESAGDLSSRLSLVTESEPNDHRDQASELQLPVIVSGTIDAPGDIDSWRLQIDDGAKLTFEIETPAMIPPHFSPRLSITNADGEEVTHNIYRKIGGDGDDWLKFVRPKVNYTFQEGGKFTITIRDLTSRGHGPIFQYRVLVREQIPHLGEVCFRTGYEQRFDHANLVPGESHTLYGVTEFEEGFEGEITLDIDNLPPGVQLRPITTTVNVESKIFPSYHRRGAPQYDWFFPKRIFVTVALNAAKDAPTTEALQLGRLVAHSIVNGEPAAYFVSQEIPLMVIDRAREEKF